MFDRRTEAARGRLSSPRVRLGLVATTSPAAAGETGRRYGQPGEEHEGPRQGVESDRAGGQQGEWVGGSESAG